VEGDIFIIIFVILEISK